jgi:hypothetical protein
MRSSVAAVTTAGKGVFHSLEGSLLLASQQSMQILDDRHAVI